MMGALGRYDLGCEKISHVTKDIPGNDVLAPLHVSPMSSCHISS